MDFRTIRPEEIDLRVGTVTEKGYTLLLYKNARVDMAMLDETVGETNWLFSASHIPIPQYRLPLISL